MYPALFHPRNRDSHKGDFGSLGILAGAAGMTGAALLAGRAALYMGAGKVFLGLADHALPCDPLHPELMLRPAADLLAHGGKLGVTNWVAGCGLGTGEDSQRLLARLLGDYAHLPIVLDADALNILAALPSLADTVASRPAPSVITPHVREASRLLGVSTQAIQADRIGAARSLAARYHAWVVLKGSGSVVCSPEGMHTINASGNPGLATAGTGDVLSGMLGALLAQGLPIEDAVRGGVWLHGAAADELVRHGIGPIGLTAGEIAMAARTIRNRPGATRQQQQQ